MFDGRWPVVTLAGCELGVHIIHCTAVNLGLYLPFVRRVLVHGHASHLTKMRGFRICISVVEVSILMGVGVMAQGDWCPTF